MKYDLTIIIINYNTNDYVRNLLESIWKADKNDYLIEIIIIDNNSEDKSKEFLKKIQSPIANHQSSKIRIILNKENLGYTKANNQGIRLAQGRYILCLNSDTVLQKDTLKIMIKFMDANDKYAGATCKILLPNGEMDKACHRGFPTPWAAFTYFSGLEKVFSNSKIFSQYHQGWLDLNSIHEILVISGAFLLIKRNIMNKVGLFDEQFFMYGEDIDLCYRLNKLGYKIAYNPNTKIIHYKKQSGRSKKKHNLITQKDLIIKERTTNYFYETMKIFYDKHYRHKYSWLVRHLMIWGIWIVSRFKN